MSYTKPRLHMKSALNQGISFLFSFRPSFISFSMNDTSLLSDSASPEHHLNYSLISSLSFLFTSNSSVCLFFNLGHSCHQEGAPEKELHIHGFGVLGTLPANDGTYSISSFSEFSDV